MVQEQEPRGPSCLDIFQVNLLELVPGEKVMQAMESRLVEGNVLLLIDLAESYQIRHQGEVMAAYFEKKP